MASRGKAAATLHAPDEPVVHLTSFPVSDRINGKPPAYELRDFAPIALVTADRRWWCTRWIGRYKNAPGLRRRREGEPGKIQLLLVGVYGRCTVAMEIFATLRLRLVPRARTQGGGPAAAALLRRRSEALASGPFGGPLADQGGGKMRALASWSDKRPPLLCRVPTFRSWLRRRVYIWSGRVRAVQPSRPPIVASCRDAVRRWRAPPSSKSAMEKVERRVVYPRAPDFRNHWERAPARAKLALEKSQVEEK